MKKILSLMLLCVLSFATIGLVGCGGTSYKNKTINIIMAAATIPPMQAMLDTINTEDETYAWIGRQNTVYSVDNLKAAYKNIKFITEWSTATNIPASVNTKMRETVSNIWYKSNKTAKFNIYVTDYGVLSAMNLVTPINVPDSNFKVHLLEDGLGAYSQFLTADNYDDATLGKTNLDANIALFNTAIDDMKKPNYVPSGDFANYNLAYASATTHPSVDYFLQFPEALTSANAEVQAMLTNKTIKLVKKNQTELYNALTPERQLDFKKIILNPALDTIMDKGEKEKVLMITGTSFTGEGGSFANFAEGGSFENLVSYLSTRYGATHKIVYKGHPSWGLLNSENGSRWEDAAKLPATGGSGTNGVYTVEDGKAARERRVEFLKSKNIEILPAQTPAEALIWAFNTDLQLCGYDSSLYMNASPKDVLCFMASTGTTITQLLSSPIKEFFSEDGMWYNKNIYILTNDTLASLPQ